MWKRSWKRLQACGHCGTVVTVLSTTRNEAFADGEPEMTIRGLALFGCARAAGSDYLVHWPPGRATGDRRLPTLYLLHGRGERMISWLPFFDRLDESVRGGLIRPLLTIAPDAPWSSRASWYVDSQFTDAADPGYPVETALTTDLAAHVDRVYPTLTDRSARIVAGYSMGGAGALRLALAHQRLYGAAIVLSPAVYAPLPPRRVERPVIGCIWPWPATLRCHPLPRVVLRCAARRRRSGASGGGIHRGRRRRTHIPGSARCSARHADRGRPAARPTEPGSGRFTSPAHLRWRPRLVDWWPALLEGLRTVAVRA